MPRDRLETNAVNRSRTAKGTQRRFKAFKARGARVRLAADHPASLAGHSIFRTKIYDAADEKSVLKKGNNSAKTGFLVEKGRWTGMPIYTLTLEERATCPRSCLQWANCYGNNMHHAHRITADATFEMLLKAELRQLSKDHPKGFVVRLHVLGDFYSTDYVKLWEKAMERHPQIRVFGYTARPINDPIGKELLRLAFKDWERFSMRFSGALIPEMAAEVILPGEKPSDGYLECPQHDRDDLCCATCALCWGTTRNIAFIEH